MQNIKDFNKDNNIPDHMGNCRNKNKCPLNEECKTEGSVYKVGVQNRKDKIKCI